MPSNNLRGCDIISDSDKIPFWINVGASIAAADFTAYAYIPFNGFIEKAFVAIGTLANNVTTVINVGITGALTRNVNGFSIEDLAAGEYPITLASNVVNRGEMLIITVDAGTPAAGVVAIGLLIGHVSEADDLVT